MAKHAHSTSSASTPIADPKMPAEQCDAFFEIGLIGHIICSLGELMTASDVEVRGSSFIWLAEEMANRVEVIERHVAAGTVGRGS